MFPWSENHSWLFRTRPKAPLVPWTIEIRKGCDSGAIGFSLSQRDLRGQEPSKEVPRPFFTPQKASLMNCFHPHDFGPCFHLPGWVPDVHRLSSEIDRNPPMTGVDSLAEGLVVLAESTTTGAGSTLFFGGQGRGQGLLFSRGRVEVCFGGKGFFLEGRVEGLLF